MTTRTPILAVLAWGASTAPAAGLVPRYPNGYPNGTDHTTPDGPRAAGGCPDRSTQ